MAKWGWRRWDARDADREIGADRSGFVVEGREIGDHGSHCWRWAARDVEREMGSCPYRMSGGTDWDSSRAIGPSGIAVTGTSIADAGLPSL